MLLLLLGFSAVNFAIGKAMFSRRGRRSGKVLVASGLVLDIGLLFLVKYLGFFTATINSLFSLSLPIPKLILPIGISFYTFRVIAYLLDVYWEKTDAELYFSDFLLFTSLFPCTVAGPIVRYSTIGKELHERRARLSDVYDGFFRICIGLGKKVILADNLYNMVQYYFEGEFFTELTVSETWFAVLVYSLYVYFDFSGYSDMAIGIGRIFGFHFEENFRYPFLCTTISEFWQRWHISLGSFFRDYLLYVPIFGKMRRYGGLFLVWFCTGLWHGASWNYVLWGLYFGVFILIETLLGKKRIRKIPILVRHLYTKFVIVIGFGIFYFTDLGRLGMFFKMLFGFAGNGFSDSISFVYMENHIFLFAAALLCTFPLAPVIRERAERHTWSCVTVQIVSGAWAFMLLLVSSLLLVNATNHAFLYAQF